MFSWRADDLGVTRAFTSRLGGVSTGPYAGLNLGGHVGDDPLAVEFVRAVGVELCAKLGITIPVGKDSLSMTTRWRDGAGAHSVVAPVSAIISAFAPIVSGGSAMASIPVVSRRCRCARKFPIRPSTILRLPSLARSDGFSR